MALGLKYGLHQSGAQGVLIDEKTRGGEARDTVSSV
jgi:hypothetical protein